ncbi:MAG: hypothetical protein U1F43_07120 [Myxococcota bacterium]
MLPKWGPRVRRLAIAHAALNASALVAWIANVVARPSDYAMSTGAWIAGAVGLGLVAVGGYLGGRMVFEFRVGVSDEHVRDVVGPSTSTPRAASIATRAAARPDDRHPAYDQEDAAGQETKTPTAPSRSGRPSTSRTA